MRKALPRGVLKDKVLHFGSCSVLDLDEEDAQDARRQLGVRVLTGFTTDVEWFASMASATVALRSVRSILTSVAE